MDMVEAFKLWAACKGDRDCRACPIFEPRADKDGVCDLFDEIFHLLKGEVVSGMPTVNPN